MRVIHDPHHDVVRIMFRAAPILRSVPGPDGISLHYGVSGSVIGLEVSEASKRFHAPHSVEMIQAGCHEDERG